MTALAVGRYFFFFADELFPALLLLVRPAAFFELALEPVVFLAPVPLDLVGMLPLPSGRAKPLKRKGGS